MADRNWPQAQATWLLRTVALLSGLALCWFALGMVRTPPSAMIAWLPLIPAALLAAVQCWMTGTARSVDPQAQRFWRTAGVGVALLGAASLANLYETLPRGGILIGPPGPIAMTVYCFSVAAFLWALVRLPLSAQTPAQRRTLWYDMGTVMLAVALFVWHFATRDLVARGLPGLPQTAASLAAIILGFVVVFTLTKATLTGADPLNRRSLRLLATGSVVACTGSALEPLTVVAPHLNVCHYTVAIATFFASWAAYAELYPRATAAARRPAVKRPFSLLPYVAVAATDVLLLATTIDPDDRDAPVVAAGAVALTGLVVIRQITSFRENARLLVRLARHERRFRSLVQNSSDIVSIITADGTIRYLSPSVHRMLGSGAEPWLEQPVWDAIHPEDRDVARAAVAAITGTPNATTTYQIRLAHQDGTWRWAEVISSNLLGDASVQGIVCNARDITEARELQNRLRHEATHDSLTGLANRTLFAERIGAALESAAGTGVAVALVDLDGFKAVNDTFGHAVGDVLLIAVARRLSGCVGPSDLVARLGGDEFAVLINDPSPATVDAVLARLHRELAEPVRTEGPDLLVGASIGVAYSLADEPPDRLLHRADIAMYASKSRRDGTHSHHTPAPAGPPLNRPGRREIRHALDTGQFRVLYQPMVGLPAGQLTGVEALLRWEHPTRGLLKPDDFIPTAERTGLIVDLGRWVLRTACRQQVTWLREFPDRAPHTIAVNVSPRQLREPDFAAHVQSALADSGLDPHRLLLEITESTAVSGPATDTNLKALDELGVTLSLDDFGTGESALALLQALPVAQVKLDRSFTDTCLEPGRRNIATAVIELARVLDLDVVAEGVENSRQARHLHAIGYRTAQGYHFHRPMPASGITAILAGEADRHRPHVA
ncbi:MAG TPA: EAL domain-containing protein [Catenuloplanes sp.]|jgi:diguanylate cyclase (GGDEF)-like protein/PAS domain S-box-containing protein